MTSYDYSLVPGVYGLRIGRKILRERRGGKGEGREERESSENYLHGLELCVRGVL